MFATGTRSGGTSRSARHGRMKPILRNHAPRSQPGAPLLPRPAPPLPEHPAPCPSVGMGPHAAPSTSHRGLQRCINPKAAPPPPHSSQKPWPCHQLQPSQGSEAQGQGHAARGGHFAKAPSLRQPTQPLLCPVLLLLGGEAPGCPPHARLPKLAQCPSVSKAACELGRRLQGSIGGTSVCCRRAHAAAHALHLASTRGLAQICPHLQTGEGKAHGIHLQGTDS